MPNRPENVIQKKKQNRETERQRLKEETNQLKEAIKGNPKVVEAIRKLERRIELLEEQE